MEDGRISSFPPIVDGNSRVLVLGTMPGAESLRQRRYYAYERNHFWTVVFALYGLERPADYDDRIKFLYEKKIALWDVLDSCERRSSADSEIKNPAPNGIADLMKQYPRIEAVFLNGNGAAKLFKRFVQHDVGSGIHVETLLSTSPAYAIPYEKKLQGWQRLLEYLSKFQ